MIIPETVLIPTGDIYIYTCLSAVEEELQLAAVKFPRVALFRWIMNLQYSGFQLNFFTKFLITSLPTERH